MPHIFCQDSLTCCKCFTSEETVTGRRRAVGGPGISDQHLIAERGHGLLTYYYLKALNSGKMDMDSIYKFLKPKVEDEARSLNIQQSPSLQKGSWIGVLTSE